MVGRLDKVQGAEMSEVGKGYSQAKGARVVWQAGRMGLRERMWVCMMQVRGGRRFRRSRVSGLKLFWKPAACKRFWGVNAISPSFWMF